MKIELFPLEKMIIDGKDIFIGAKKEDVIKLLGEPENKHENYGGNGWGYYYQEFACHFDNNDELEAIEFLYGHDGKLKPYIYGVSAFDVSRKELFEILKNTIMVESMKRMKIVMALLRSVLEYGKILLMKIMIIGQQY